MDFALPEAAEIAGMDKRSFRLLMDRRLIFATPRTRTMGRGKQKLYPVDEIVIAAVLSHLMRMGANTFDLSEISDWLRGGLRGATLNAARSGTVAYFVIEYKIETDAQTRTPIDYRVFRFAELSLGQIEFGESWPSSLVSVNVTHAKQDVLARVNEVLARHQ